MSCHAQFPIYFLTLILGNLWPTLLSQTVNLQSNLNYSDIAGS